MKIEKVNYQKAYIIGPYLQEKVGFEASYDPAEETEKEVLTKLRTISDEWHKANNPLLHLDMGFGPPAEVFVDRGNPHESLKRDINSCADIKVLETYKLLVRGNEELQAEYEKKLAELKK